MLLDPVLEVPVAVRPAAARSLQLGRAEKVLARAADLASQRQVASTAWPRQAARAVLNSVQEAVRSELGRLQARLRWTMTKALASGSAPFARLRRQPGARCSRRRTDASPLAHRYQAEPPSHCSPRQTLRPRRRREATHSASH